MFWPHSTPAFWVKTAVLSVGWLLLRLLKSASWCFCNSRKNRCCFFSFSCSFSIFPSNNWKVFLHFFVEVEVVFLRFTSEVEGVFAHFFVPFPYFLVTTEKVFLRFLLRLHLEPHHLHKHFFKVFHFLDLRKIFLFKKIVFFSGAGKFFPFSKYPQKSRIITVWVHVFCTTQYCKRQIKFFSLKWGWGERKIWKSIFDYVTIYLHFFLNIRYPTHSVVCTIWYLVVV